MIKKYLNFYNKPISIFFASLVVSFIFFGINLNAKMGIIDDSSYLSRGVISNQREVVTNLISAPEITSFGGSQRFRIIYYLANDLETAVFGFNAPFFYLTNILIFAFFIFTIYHIGKGYIGGLWALLVTVFLISQKYFAHIFTRLGTAETWAILGLSIFALSFNSIYKKSTADSEENFGWKELLGLLFGSVLMLGSKENFALVGAIIVILFGVLYSRKEISRNFFLTSISIIALNIYQTLYVFFAQKNSGVDIYQNNTSGLYRLKLTIQGALSSDARNITFIFVLFLLTIAAFLYTEFRNGKIDRSSTRIKIFFWSPLIIIVISGLIFTFNLFFYNGIFYTLSRYAFPSIFIAQLLLVYYIYYVFRLVKERYKNIDYDSLFIIFAPVIGLFLLFQLVTTIKYSVFMSRLNVEATTQFHNKLEEMTSVIKANPDRDIVFSTYDPIDFEPIGAVALYLRDYYKISNKMMVKSYIPAEDVNNLSLTKWIDSQIKLYEAGNEVFAPNTKTSNNCYNIDFSGETNSTQCYNLGKIWRYGSYPY